ncbi:DUF805 domain-containing protein [Lacticaseibacillus baoqingensis]|uniref:DUF805 domain-containing protein n=1 Tax=Lacticaseibacillus baoqingensis TaxID=2486013 RepID=A0ABW4E3K0_9LACO|nr:DUF805 domain-containing protein [Lacticaseibacillus baoqingensis]
MKTPDQELWAQTHNRYYGFGGIGALWAFFANYVNFTGRSTRGEYWWFQLWRVVFSILVLGGLLLSAFGSFARFKTGTSPELHGGQITVLIVLIFLLFVLAFGTLIPSLTLGVRRYRDAGIHWSVYAGIQLLLLVAGLAMDIVHGSVSVLLSVSIIALTVVNFVITVLPSKPLPPVSDQEALY